MPGCYIDINDACNLKCPTCARGLRLMANSSKSMTFNLFRAIVEEHEVKLGKLAQPVRVALTGGTQSPGIFEVIDVIGKEKTLNRLGQAIELIGK